MGYTTLTGTKNFILLLGRSADDDELSLRTPYVCKLLICIPLCYFPPTVIHAV